MSDSELNTVEDRTYWSHLGSIGIQAVHAESEKIKSEKESVASGTRTLAFEHYPTFIATSDCGKDAAVHLEASHKHVENLAENLPPLRQACLDFESEAKSLSMKRKSTSLVLARHTRLLEILELPQLVETCVRNGHYDEALELRQYASRIAKKLGNIPIVNEVVKTVKQSSKVMLNQLLSQLRAPIQLPACLKVVGYLRRMDAFSNETELRLRFLQARDSWLCSVLKSVPKDDAYEHLSKSLELTRVHLLDIVTQYRALFPDDDAYASGTMHTTSLSHRAMFSTWLESKINQFLMTLQHDLDAGAKKQSLDSILSQAMYFGQSLGRVGADFRPSLARILSRAALDIALEHLSGTEQRFKNGIEQMALKAIASTANEEKNESKREEDQYQPPLGLLDFIPLAELCNSILSSLNEIRLCAPISLAPSIISRIEEVLISAVHTLRDREARFGKSSIETEKATFQQLVLIFCQKFLPYIDRCLKRIFPLNQQSLVTSDAKFALNIEKILEEMPLKEIVMAKTSTPTMIPNPVVNQQEVKEEATAPTYVVDRVSVISQEIEKSDNQSAEE